jgi:hypothetical protein
MVLVEANGVTQVTDKIIGCGIKVHRLLGPGLLETPYKVALVYYRTADPHATWSPFL